jgi:hypothetical protein
LSANGAQLPRRPAQQPGINRDDPKVDTDPGSSTGRSDWDMRVG